MGAYRHRHSGPIHVLGGDKRHALDGGRDKRLVLLKPTDAAAPDIMIVAVRGDLAATVRERMTPALARRIAEGGCALVFDASGEGPSFDNSRIGQMHQLLAEFEIPAARCAYMTQNRDFAAAYRAWSPAEGSRMKVLEYDDYIRRFFQDYDHTGAETFAARKAAFEARGPIREKRFVCLNYSQRQAKVLLLLKLIQGGQWDQGFISFPGFDAAVNSRAVRKSAMAHDIKTLPGFEDMGEALAPLLDDLDAKGSLMLGEMKTGAGMPHHFKNVAADMGLEEYQRAWFTVITETEMVDTRRITEKPFKALANFSPLIILGNAGSLALLRFWEFRTFEGLFDESYDAEPDARRRFEMVYEEVRRLCALPEAALRDAVQAMNETIVFNAERALVHMPRIYRTKFEPWLIDQILDLRQPA